MNHGITPGAIPAPQGLEKEEPELAYEEDIPSDDDGVSDLDETASDEQPLRDVERE